LESVELRPPFIFAESKLISLIVVMGVSGSGKTCVGQYLARHLGTEFVDADDLHSAENVALMAAGQPLDDHTRKPWLASICQCAESNFTQRQSVVIACSALKESYRATLRSVSRPVVFVFLRGPQDLIHKRMNRREGHFMPASLLESQFADLEDPAGEPNVVTVEIDQPLESMLPEAWDKTRIELARISERDTGMTADGG
jgi:gluconokinase